MITREYLRSHPNEIFVFGDNLLRTGYGGAASLRDEPNTYGFITKKAPDNKAKSFYKPKEYDYVFAAKLYELTGYVKYNPHKTFLISKLGSGLANKYGIFEKVIEPTLKHHFKRYQNVRFLW